MKQQSTELQLSKIESVFIVGIIGCLLLATWELCHLLADEYLYSWVITDRFTNKRIIYYGIAFIMSGASIFTTTKFALSQNRFSQTISRAFLWYGTLLLISTIAIFVFDCLPEVFAGITGALVFMASIYFMQKKFFNPKRIAKLRLSKGNCGNCGTTIKDKSFFCSSCGKEVGSKCSSCNEWNSLISNFCTSCGTAQN